MFYRVGMREATSQQQQLAVNVEDCILLNNSPYFMQKKPSI